MPVISLQLSPVVFSLFFYGITSVLSETKNNVYDYNNNFYYLPGLNRESYSLQGDINIGALASATTLATGYQCTKNMTLDTSWGIQYIEAIAFAVREINNDSNILPNLTLGFVILDDCRNDNIALGQSLNFLPQEIQCNSDETCHDVSDTGLPLSTNTPHNMGPYDVVGILGPFSSSRTVSVSTLYSVAQIPIVSYMASSDSLSDKTLHPYFLRLIPPDKHQVLAMLKFISKNGWSYISVVYELGSYGETAFTTIKDNSEEYGICLAASHRSNRLSDFDAIVLDLLRYPSARVVILFVYIESAAGILRSSWRLADKGHFIWIGSDAWADKISSQEDLKQKALGSFVFMFQSKEVPGLYDHFKRLNVNSTTNPWIKTYWEMIAQCSFDDKTCNTRIGLAEVEGFKFIPATSSAVDSVYTFAYAIQHLLEDRCLGVLKDKARNCITGDVLLSYLLNTSIQGYSGKIEFDDNGDLMGRYLIAQFSSQIENVVTGTLNEAFQTNYIAEYDVFGGDVRYTGHPISWEYFPLETHGVLILSTGENGSMEIPKSVCSRPCVQGEYLIQKEPECCWECSSCRDNEKLVHNDSECEECEKFTWPDKETNFTTCTPIPLSHASISGPISLTIVIIGTFGLVSVALVTAGHVFFKDTEIIKASSPELTSIQIVAIFFGYITVVLLQTTPTHGLCSFLYFLFCLSFASLYSALLIQTLRIYSTFESGSGNNRRPPGFHPQAQLIVVVVLILIQVVLCLAIYGIYRPTARKRQPVLTEKFVELSCDMTLPGLASFLTYSLVLIFLCSVFAFKTRKLPDNFNESRFISMCVSTTLVIWLAFIFTYFTLYKAFVRSLLLSLVLLLNHSVALIFLFAPKIYSAFLDAKFPSEGKRSTTSPKPGTSVVVRSSREIVDGNSTDL